MPISIDEVLDFWFLAPGSAGHGAMRVEWFRKDGPFDCSIKARFGRFPHRNRILGRSSTPPQQQCLLEPGSSF